MHSQKKFNLRILSLVLLSGLFSTQAIAAEGDDAIGTVGLGSYVLSLAINSNTYDYSGSALTVGFNFNSWASIYGHVYALTNTTWETEKIDGSDIMIRFGKTGDGLMGFGSLGYYSETLSDTGYPSVDFSGTFIGYGIGYNWEHVSLVLEGSARGTNEYETFANSTDVIAATGSLNISYRF